MRISAYKLVLATALMVFSSAPAALGAQCTSETATGRRLVLGVATQYTQARPSAVPVVSPGEVRLLANPGDSPVCQQLFNAFRAQWRNPDEPRPDWLWSYYQVGDLYYVVAHRSQPPVKKNADGTFNISLNWSPVFVIDRSYQVLASFAR